MYDEETQNIIVEGNEGYQKSSIIYENNYAI